MTRSPGRPVTSVPSLFARSVVRSLRPTAATSSGAAPTTTQAVFAAGASEVAIPPPWSLPTSAATPPRARADSPLAPFAPPGREIATTVHERHDGDAVRMHFIHQAVVANEDLARTLV